MTSEAFGILRDLYVIYIPTLHRVFESNFRTLHGDGIYNYTSL
ncbi:hypothetical protein APHMUC_0844 [Anaplasma phagocytophilum str. ApMUC09]|uniref:Uncharacterized protein n=1 Tax=Anaplasma phagocytophilum str. ApMUC09 TaxID=1359152 RepID=A0A0F3NA56_ANAPH|nr:hypothetical protein APHMUC_0844 [Anaplasma phagocytophilum str. ApMUC09]